MRITTIGKGIFNDKLGRYRLIDIDTLPFAVSYSSKISS